MPDSTPTRRTILQGATLAATAAIAPRVHAKAEDTIRIGLIGAGGRGSGAAAQQLNADSQTKIVAVADAFMDRAEASRENLRKQYGDRVTADAETTFAGLDAYKKVLATDCDVVILATPPGFRPLHMEAAIKAGKHVFAEKPVAVDATGVRRVIAAGEEARQKNLLVVSGLCWRYETQSIEMMDKIHNGAIGRPIMLHAVRHGRGVWVRDRLPGMTDVQYQTLNWYYWTWLSGDFIAEMFVHELDRMAWLMKDVYPTQVVATGGRIVRTGPNYGHIYDHFAATFDYPDSAQFHATTRHQQPSDNVFRVEATGTAGAVDLQSRRFTAGDHADWKPESKRRSMHQLEQNAMFAALRAGQYINNTDYMAKSTLMAIMAREAAYTGKVIQWDDALNDPQDLVPDDLTWQSTLPEWKVPVPGQKWH